MAAVQQIFDADCDVGDFKRFPELMPQTLTLLAFQKGRYLPHVVRLLYLK